MMEDVDVGVEISDEILNVSRGEKNNSFHLSDKETDTEYNEGNTITEKKCTSRVVALIVAWTAAILLASTMLVSTAFTFFGAKKSSNRGSGESLEVSSVNSAAINLADCLKEEERATATAALLDQQLAAATETEEPTLMPTTHEPSASPMEFVNSNDISLDGPIRRNLRSSSGSDTSEKRVSTIRTSYMIIQFVMYYVMPNIMCVCIHSEASMRGDPCSV